MEEKTCDFVLSMWNQLTFQIFVSRSTSCFPDMSIASMLKTTKQIKDQIMKFKKYQEGTEKRKYVINGYHLPSQGKDGNVIFT